MACIYGTTLPYFEIMAAKTEEVANNDACSTVERWPVTDNDGYYQSYQENGRWTNWWARGRPGFVGVMKFLFKGKDESNIPSSSELDKTLPVQKPYWMSSKQNNPSKVGLPGIRATWIGHATALAEVDGCVVLTDPVFSQRASAVQWTGPTRYRPAACTVEQLPENLNAVVVSHNHYDHLDYNSVKDLLKRYGERLHWFVPRGIGSWIKYNFPNCLEDNIHELVWWEEGKIPGSNVKFVLTPSNHWCQRGTMDNNKSLWGSWAVIGPKHRFWFGGDTAYSDAFAQIGKRYGAFHLSAIPIGAYNPQWFMKWVHVNPIEAIMIHEDIKSLKSFGIHWGTFKLTYEHYLEPKELTLSEAAKKEMTDGEFSVVDIGCTVEGASNQQPN